MYFNFIFAVFLLVIVKCADSLNFLKTNKFDRSNLFSSDFKNSSTKSDKFDLSQKKLAENSIFSKCVGRKLKSFFFLLNGSQNLKNFNGRRWFGLDSSKISVEIRPGVGGKESLIWASELAKASFPSNLHRYPN